jgi:hypothetical protein
MGEWFIELGYEVQLVPWLVASFLLYVLAAQLVWQFQWYSPSGPFSASSLSQHPGPYPYLGRDHRSGHLINRLRSLLANPWIEEAIRLCYYLGIPFLAAVNGLLGADLLGIGGTNWLDSTSAWGFLWEDWVRGVGLAVAALLAIVGAWFTARLISGRAGLRSVALAGYGPFGQRLLHALYDQIHWAFYRSGPILWLGDLYWGTFVGLALVLLETALNPALWWALKSPEAAGPALFRLGMAWVSALLFVATRNLWLTAGVHLVLVGLLGGTQARSYAPADESAE